MHGDYLGPPDVSRVIGFKYHTKHAGEAGEAHNTLYLNGIPKFCACVFIMDVCKVLMFLRGQMSQILKLCKHFELVTSAVPRQL